MSFHLPDWQAQMPSRFYSVFDSCFWEGKGLLFLLGADAGTTAVGGACVFSRIFSLVVVASFESCIN